MDITRFSPSATGSLIPILTPEPDYAFVPAPLPAKWLFDSNLWPLLLEAKGELLRLDGMARTLPHPELLLGPLQRNESLTSSRLEGTYATAEELMLFELDPRAPQNAHDPANAWIEVHNYKLALSQGFRLLETLPFCLRLFKDLHATLLSGVRGSSKNPGEFRNHQVHIGSKRRYVPPVAADLLSNLSALENYCNNPQDSFDPLVRCFLTHYQIEAIHPFSDGNGRIGRVLLSLMIFKWCDLKMPWLYLSPYFERYKDEYIDSLFRVSTDGDWSRWIEFCLRGVVIQAKDAAKKCDQLRELREEMRCRVTDYGGRAPAIIDKLFDSPLLRGSDIRKWHSVTRPTSLKDIEYLVSKGVLKELTPKRGRSRTYFSPEIISIAYRDQEF